MGDFLRSPVRTDAEVAANIEVENPRHYLEALASGKGVIAVTAHLGNWERFAQWVRTTGHHISVVARDADQAGVQARILAIRQSTGLTVLSRGSSAREILKLLRQGEVVGILPDQNTDECFVPFFGHPCGTVLGPAVLHQRTGAVLLPSYCVRTGPAKYRVIFGEPIDWDNEEKDQVALTTQMSAVLESVIRQYPEQWLWMHDRWKAARRKGLL